MCKQIETYNFKMHYFSGVKSLWPVQNNQAVIDAIKKLNNRNKALSIATYDFFTLSTNIPHNELKNVIWELIHFCFKGRGKPFIALTKFGATWTDNNKVIINFDKAFLKLAINFFLMNVFLILVMCPFVKSLALARIQTQHLSWKIYFCIIMKINGY